MFLSRLRSSFASASRRSPLSPLFAMLLLSLPLLAVGCGGGGDDNDDNDGDNTTRIVDFLDTSDFYDADDDFYYDIYIVRVRDGGNVTINAFSNNFDIFLGAEEETGDNINEFDDNDGGGTNARIDFDADEDQEISVGVGSADGGLGQYEVIFSDRLELIGSSRVRGRDLSPGMLAQFKALRASKKAAVMTAPATPAPAAAP